MITSKQRAELRALAGKTEPSFQIGKEGISPALITGLSQSLTKNELIKITVLKTAGISAKQLIAELAQKLYAEPVTAIGHKIVLYRRNDDKDFKHILE